MTFKCPDRYRIRTGDYGSATGDPFGAFFVPHPPRSVYVNNHPYCLHI